MIRIFIGWDSRQPIAYHVLAHSIVRWASVPVSITPLVLDNLPLTRRGLTPFTFSRFLVPYLCDYEGKAIFMDADMLCCADVKGLMDAASDDAVSVVKSEQRFEWPSLMVFNNAHPKCKALTPLFVETGENPLMLEWAGQSIGSLPHEWNHCVGYDAPRDNPCLIHYTQGVPIWPETKGCEHSDKWHAEWKSMNSAVSWQTLMGQSVHVEAVQKRLAEQAA